MQPTCNEYILELQQRVNATPKLSPMSGFLPANRINLALLGILGITAAASLLVWK